MAKKTKSEKNSSDESQDKKLIKKAFKLHDEQRHEGSKTNLSKLKKGGACKW